MPFSADERQRLLSVKGVGPKVLSRIEELGIEDLATLARQDAAELCRLAAGLTGSTCWRNSPQARAAITGAIAEARAGISNNGSNLAFRTLGM